MRSIFDFYELENGIICVEDQCEPLSMSVTNDAERVVSYIISMYPLAKAIIYRDTEGNWDQLLFERGKFTTYKCLATKERSQAVQKVSGEFIYGKKI